MSGSGGLSIGSRGYSGSLGGYGYYFLKGIGKMRDSFRRFEKFMEQCRETTMSDVGFRCAFKERWFC